MTGRNRHLFDAPLRAFEEPYWPERSGWDRHQTPNLLWPENNSWFLASEIDFDSTIVGGSAALITELVRSPDLEAAIIRPEAGLGAFSDAVNER